MVLTTIALIWLTTAAVFVLALGLAAAKQMPHSESLQDGVLIGSSQDDDFTRDDDASVTHLYCGRSIKLASGRPCADANLNWTGQRDGTTDVQSDDSKQVVSF